MKSINQINDKKVPVVRIDKSLDKFDDAVLFPDKVAKANEMLRTVGLPIGKTKHRRA